MSPQQNSHLLNVPLKVTSGFLRVILKPVPVPQTLPAIRILPRPGLADGTGFQKLLHLTGFDGIFDLRILLHKRVVLLLCLRRRIGNGPDTIHAGTVLQTVVITQDQRLALPTEEKLLIIRVLQEGAQSVYAVHEGERHIAEHEANLRRGASRTADVQPCVKQDFQLILIEHVIGQIEENKINACGIQHIRMLAVDPCVVAGIVSEVRLCPVGTVAPGKGAEHSGEEIKAFFQVGSGHIVGVPTGKMRVEHEVKHTHEAILALPCLIGRGDTTEIVHRNPRRVIHRESRLCLCRDNIHMAVRDVICIAARGVKIDGGIACAGGMGRFCRHVTASKRLRVGIVSDRCDNLPVTQHLQCGNGIPECHPVCGSVRKDNAGIDINGKAVPLADGHMPVRSQRENNAGVGGRIVFQHLPQSDGQGACRQGEVKGKLAAAQSVVVAQDAPGEEGAVTERPATELPVHDQGIRQTGKSKVQTNVILLRRSGEIHGVVILTVQVIEFSVRGQFPVRRLCSRIGALVGAVIRGGLCRLLRLFHLIVGEIIPERGGCLLGTEQSHIRNVCIVCPLD